MTVIDVMRVIDDATGPKVMSAAAALDFLEALSAELSVRMDALKDDLENDDGD